MSTERSASAQPDREASSTSTPGVATRDQGSADFQRTPHGSEGSDSPLHPTPTCDKCGVECTTGMMAAFCSKGRECEFWPHSNGEVALAGGELLMYRFWMDNTLEQIGLQIEDRKRLEADVTAIEKDRDAYRAILQGMDFPPLAHIDRMEDLSVVLALSIGENYRAVPLAEFERQKGAISDGMPKWTSPGERVPEDGQMVLGFWPAWSGPISMESLTYHAADGPDGPACWRDWENHRADEPTHWMPLPEAPK